MSTKVEFAINLKTAKLLALVESASIRTMLLVPMLKEDELIGAIVIHRQEVRPFTDKQLGLITNFAAQAVIAIENTRLLNELRESLQQQTATSEVLRVISSSPGELEPVFRTMLANAVRICEAKFGNMSLYDGDVFYALPFATATNCPGQDARPLRPQIVRQVFIALGRRNLDGEGNDADPPPEGGVGAEAGRWQRTTA
jgi:hypothetical protein